MHIIDGREPHVLLRELFTDEGVGTMIVRQTSEQTLPEKVVAHVTRQGD